MGSLPRLWPTFACEGVGVEIVDPRLAAYIERFSSPYDALLAEHVRSDPRAACVILSVRDGVTLIRRRDT